MIIFGFVLKVEKTVFPNKLCVGSERERDQGCQDFCTDGWSFRFERDGKMFVFVLVK